VPILAENKRRYPADWPARSRFVRFYRAKGKCEWCGAIHGQAHPITGALVVLTTAHVYDDRPEAAALDNLAALCQKCHNGHDAAGRAARRRQRLDREAGQGDMFRPP
jgi:5-methylcytosine-specific restriction endonuclease McrA